MRMSTKCRAFFDTANMYSNGGSEEIVGRALKDFTNCDSVVIATKRPGMELCLDVLEGAAHQSAQFAGDRYREVAAARYFPVHRSGLDRTTYASTSTPVPRSQPLAADHSAGNRMKFFPSSGRG